MKKTVYYFTFLFCLVFSSCGNKINVNKINEEDNKNEPADLWKNQYRYVDSELVSAATNTYDEKGFLTDQLTWTVGKSQTKTVARNYMKYEYNQAGLMTASHSQIVENGILISTTSNLIKYDSHNNVIKEANVTDCVADYVMNCSYVYDENNNIVEKSVETFNREGLDKRQRYFCSYDNDNRLVSETSYSWNDGSTNPYEADIDTTNYVYDKNKVITTRYVKNYGDVYMTKTISASEYNDKQKLKSSVVYSYRYTTGEAEELRTKDEIYCDYDEYGNLRSRTKYSSSPSVGEFGLNEEVDSYTYCGRNHDKILSSIHIAIKIHKIGQPDNEKSSYTAVNNYYDDKERLIKSETLAGGNGKESVTIRTVVNEY